MSSDTVTLQVVVPVELLSVYTALVDICGFEDYSELHSNAMNLLCWAVETAAEGEFVSRYSMQDHTVTTQIGVPFLDEIRMYADKHGGQMILTQLK